MEMLFRRPTSIHLLTLVLLFIYSFPFITFSSDLISIPHGQPQIINTTNNDLDDIDKSSLLALKSRFTTTINHTTTTTTPPTSSSIFFIDWSPKTSVCNWTGVTCGRGRRGGGWLHPRVVGLDIWNMGVGGTIPPHLGNLTFLVTLKMYSNSFHGNLPHQLAQLRRLKVLDVSFNRFDGELTQYYWFRNMSRLEELYLHQNMFHGTIPGSIFNISTLKIINLSQNRVSGRLPGDMCIRGGLHALELFDVSNNMITGELPPTLSHCSQLKILTLSFNNFMGELPKGIANITNLEGLAAQNNSLTGSIPAEIGNLNNLWVIALQQNNLSGSMPPEIGKLQNLASFALFGNKLSGPLPLTIGNLSSLTFVYLNSNNFIGQIPPSICNLSFLNIIDLSENQMGGAIPECIGNFSSALRVLALRENHFTGSIPQTFVDSLLYLSLGGNKLEGTLPTTSLVHCRQLQVLDVGNNQLRDLFPSWTDSLPELRVLIINSNRFYGKVVPSSSMNKTRSPFPFLRILDISGNTFSGAVPDEYMKNFIAMKERTGGGDFYMFDIQSMAQVIKGVERLVDGKKMIDLFRIVDLSDNEFEGSIPNSIGNLIFLKYLNLSHNRLIGSIPQTLGNLSSLEALDLSWNQLIGQIPRELTRLTFLSVLNLSWNHLTGPIPSGRQFGTFDSSSYLGNPELCGYPFVSKRCRHQQQENGLQQRRPRIILGGGKDEGFLSWRAVVIGYGVGIIVGVEMVCVMFMWRRPKWLLKVYNKFECWIIEGN